MRRFLSCFAAFYLFFSVAISVAYNVFPGAAWDIASHRCGLLVASVDADGVWFLNPFSGAADDWMFCIGGCRNAD